MDISMAGYIKKDLDQVTTPHPQKSIKRTAQSGSKTICGKGAIRERNGWYTVTFSSRNQTPAIKDRKPLISWDICVHEVVSWTNNPGLIKIPCNISNGYINGAAVKWLCYTSICSHPVQTKRHDSCNSQWCLIPFQAKSENSIIREILINKQTKTSPTYDEKWISACGIHHHPQCNIIGVRDWVHGTVSQCKRRCQHKEYVRINVPPTSINAPTYKKSTSEGIVNRTNVQKCSRAMDICFYWLRDWENQKHFQVYWAPGSWNIG